MSGINFRRRMLMGAAHYNAPSPEESITLYDYLVQDGSTYFATDIPITPTSRIVVSYYAGGKGAILCGCDHYNSDGNLDYFKIVYLSSSSLCGRIFINILLRQPYLGQFLSVLEQEDV